MKKLLLCCLGLSLAAHSAASDIADAAERGDIERVFALQAQGADINEPQVDGETALHWIVRWDDIAAARRLIDAGADVAVANRAGATPLQLAAINGSTAMLEVLLEAGVDPNAPLTVTEDTALMMAARTGIPEAVEVLIEHGADVNASEAWGGTTPLMWAVAENHAEVARILIEHGADVDARTVYIPPATGRGFEGFQPQPRSAEETGFVEFASGELTPLMFAAREGHLEVAEVLVQAGADLNAQAADGKDSISLAIFNGNYAFASYLVDMGADVNHADAQNFTPLFWAVDRRNMETAPNFTWLVTEDPLPLVKQLLEAGADPNYLVNNTPRARIRGGSPRIVFATAVMRAAFSGDLELTQLLLDYGADPFIKSSDNETTLSAAAGTGFIHGYHKERPYEERLEVIKLLVELGLDVNWQDDYGISPLMVAANLGNVPIIQYLIDQGADLGAYDLGKKNDGSFGASIEPLMPIDYAIGVGTFRPNNAIVFNEEAFNLMNRLMQERGIEHTTSECTLRGFTCSVADMDPRAATPLTIELAKALATGHQVDILEKGSGLEVAEDCLDVSLPFGEVAEGSEACAQEAEDAQ